MTCALIAPWKLLFSNNSRDISRTARPIPHFNAFLMPNPNMIMKICISEILENKIEIFELSSMLITWARGEDSTENWTGLGDTIKLPNSSFLTLSHNLTMVWWFRGLGLFLKNISLANLNMIHKIEIGCMGFWVQWKPVKCMMSGAITTVCCVQMNELLVPVQL